MDTKGLIPEFFKEKSSAAEAEIRAIEHELAKAVRAGDLHKIMSFYESDVGL